MKILILGAGFIGKNLLESYLLSGDTVRVLDRNVCPHQYIGRVEWIKGSFGDYEIMQQAVNGVDVVFHLVSSTVPRDAVDENDEILKNVIQTIKLLKVCVTQKIKRLVFISSASVYGISRALPICETAQTDPISSHGIHKLMIEKYLQYYGYQHGLDFKIMRLSNPYGCGQNIYGRQGFIAIALGKILKKETIHVLGDGSAIRDYLHVDDVIAACRLMATNTAAENIFNIGSGRGMKLNEVLDELRNMVRERLSVVYEVTRKTDIPASILDISKAKKVLGFYPRIPFKDGLRRTLNFYVRDAQENET
jgi:UDP-glucose 4-epimerase